MPDRSERDRTNYNPNNNTGMYGVGMKDTTGGGMYDLSSPDQYPSREHATGSFDPAGATYIIAQGDTLYSIAQRFNTTIDALRNLNGANALKMDSGTKLKIAPGLHVDETKKEDTIEQKHTSEPAKEQKAHNDPQSFMQRYMEENNARFAVADHTKVVQPPLVHGAITPQSGQSKPLLQKDKVSSPEKSTKFDVDKALKTLDNNAKSASTHKCGLFVGNALQAGGINVMANGADYGPLLKANGFSVVSKKNYSPAKGDVVVFDATGTHAYGHVAMWVGTEWVSDFKQGWIGERPGYEGMGKGFMVYSSDIPNSTIYRH